MIRTKRVYDTPDEGDGFRVLVERLWPRGMRKERAAIDLWMRDAGASPALRKWFAHDPAKWEEFEDKYFYELSEKPEVIDQLAGLAREHPVITFLFAAKDEEHNNAVALKQYLDMRGMG
ncbi:MAG: hypothetical protein BWY93_00214 [Euryarchaeota archaeon ADurb.BinA087]|nr:MAG: hypothetical protein BWY93_00214 [Euryarchaeota archaeon ADurb.BinA087]